ncbi:MAG: class I SAM-dependent methyltransferase [bacterium]
MPNPAKYGFRIITDYSYNAVKTWNKKIDLLWLDGDHNYEAVKRDFLDWKRHVVPDGRIAIHDSRRLASPNIPESDYNRGWPGPTQLANEIKKNYHPEFESEIEMGSITVFKKNAG